MKAKLINTTSLLTTNADILEEFDDKRRKVDLSYRAGFIVLD
jgi:hypothetical protein